MRYNIPRTKLAITRCLIIGDYRRITDVDTPQEPLRNINRLCKQLEQEFPDKYNYDTLHKTLRKAETTGLSRVDKELVFHLTEILHVTSQELYNVKGTVNG